MPARSTKHFPFSSAKTTEHGIKVHTAGFVSDNHRVEGEDEINVRWQRVARNANNNATNATIVPPKKKKKIKKCNPYNDCDGGVVFAAWLVTVGLPIALLSFVCYKFWQPDDGGEK